LIFTKKSTCINDSNQKGVWLQMKADQALAVGY